MLKNNNYKKNDFTHEISDDEFLVANNVDIRKYDPSYEYAKIKQIEQIKTFNPFNIIKNKKDIKLLKLEIERKAINKKRRVERIKNKKILLNNLKKYYKYALYVLVGVVLVFLGTSIYKTIDLKAHQIKEIKFTIEENEIYLGDKINLEYSIIPDNAKYNQDNIEIICNGKNAQNVSFDKTGIYEFCINYNGVTYDAKTVKVLPIMVKEIKVENVSVGVNQSEKINVNIYPSNATNKMIDYYVDDTSIAKIKNGQVYGLKEGTTNATAKTKDGIECAFKIDVQYIKIESLLIEVIDDDYKVGDTVHLRTTISPKENSSTSKVEYKSLNPNVVKVDENGNLVAVAAGSATIAATIDGLKNSATVKVKSQIKEESVSDNTSISSTNNKKTETSSSTNYSGSGYSYILNKKTGAFHYPDCRDVNKMNEENKIYSYDNRQTIIDNGYHPCGHCHP